jgi:U3 small nucleolar RNA-associated protein 14
LRSLRAPESHFLRSLRAGGHFLRSLRSDNDDKRAPGHFLRSLRAPAGSSFLRSLRDDPNQVSIDEEDTIPLDGLVDGQNEFDVIDYDGSSDE